MWSDILQGTWTGLLYAASLVLALVGIGGCILPYAGHFIILGSCMTYALAQGEPYPAWPVWVWLVLLAVFGTFVDNLTTALGAKRFGGGRAAFWFSLLGLVIGTVFFFPEGLILGPFAGAFVAEWLLARRSPKDAAKAGLGATLGMLSGAGCKILIAFIMMLTILLCCP